MKVQVYTEVKCLVEKKVPVNKLSRVILRYIQMPNYLKINSGLLSFLGRNTYAHNQRAERERKMWENEIDQP